MRKRTSVLLFILSLVLFVPGLTQPLMTIEASFDKQEMLMLGAELLTEPGQDGGFIKNMVISLIEEMNIQGDVMVFESTRSLLSTMTDLLTHGHIIVGVLIGLFGVVIPVSKILLVVLSFFCHSDSRKQKLLTLNGALSKWSMSDVFVMALIVTFLAINANEYSANSVQMSASFGTGFYYFAAYCLVSIAASQLMGRTSNQPKNESTA